MKKFLKKKRNATLPIESNITNIIYSKFIYSANKNILEESVIPLYLFKGTSQEKSRNNSKSYFNWDKITIDDLYFDKSREKAMTIMQSINEAKEKTQISEIILKSLSYDNINPIILLNSLKISHKFNLEEVNSKLAKEYKHLLNKSLIRNQDKEFAQFYNLDIPKNETTVKDDLINIIKIVLNLAELNIGKKNSDLLKFELKIQNDEIVLLSEDKDGGETEDEDEKQINELIKSIKEYYKKYRFVNDFINNQPIKYRLNETFYFVCIINNIFSVLLTNKKTKDDIIEIQFEVSKLDQILLMDNFISNKLLIILSKESIENQYLNEVDNIIKLFLFNIDSKHIKNHENFGKNIIIRNKDNNNISKKLLENFIKTKKNLQINEYITVNTDDFIINYKDYKIKFRYDDYPEYTLEEIFQKKKLFRNIQKIRYKNCYFDSFQKNNFFSENEIDYLKYLVRQIMNSVFFNEIFKAYAEKDTIPIEFIKDKRIQDYIIENITFLPYNENDFDTQSITFKQTAEIIISGYPFADENIYDNIGIHHILELGRKVIVIIHELTHSCKIYLYIATNGLIDSETIDELSNETEAGFLLENIVFGWEFGEYKEGTGKLYNGNKNLKKKYLDVKTALLFLNPELYNNDINSFKEIIYDNKDSLSYKKFEKVKENKFLKKFLFDLGFQTEEKIQELKENKSKISIGRKSYLSNIISAEFGCGNDPEKKK